MLVQPRRHALRLVTQHDHAMASGAMAAAWRGPGGDAPLPPLLVVATALHDVVWRDEDARPSLDPDSGLPLDFAAFPPERKRALTAAGLARLDAVEPEVARLVRLHHETLGTAVEPPRALAWIRLFDRLSLWVCLTPPGSLEAHRPSWLGDRVAAPDGTALRLAWEGEGHLRVDPWPFAGERLVLAIPHRDLPTGRWSQEEELVDAWHQAEAAHATVSLTG